MILLSVDDVVKHYGPEPVLAGVTFEVRPGERVGLVGPNGVGKTTLFNIVAGKDEADRGAVALHPSARLGLLEQHPQFPPGRTVWDVARSGLSRLTDLAVEAERVAAQIAQADNDAERLRLAHRFDRLQQELHQHGAYHFEHRVEAVLQGLGFAASAFEQPVDQLSGGQQNRLLLARLLLEEPDVLLLDEPSNHLDIEATEWLETYLTDTEQTLLVVSHDRYFLDKVTNRTLELFRGTVESYPGNFTTYRKLKAERLEVTRRAYEKQREEVAKMEEFIRRNHYGQKSQQAEDRRKKLERVELVPPPREITAPPMAFPGCPRVGDVALRVTGYAKAFDQPLFQDLTFQIARGEKWGVLGPNGSGKTTLLRCLLGEIEPTAGEARFGAGVKLGYFDQRLSMVDPDALVVDAIRPDHKEFFEQARRDLLARFGVKGDMVFQRVRSLSGGERNRVALARLAASDANFLVLDEPTNHLDLWARAALEEALRQFDGTLLFVSHDRYFLNQVADHLLVVEPGRFRVFDGNYDFYTHLARVGRAAGDQGGLARGGEGKPRGEKGGANPGENGAPGGDHGGRPAKAKRKRKFPYRKVGELEADIAAHEARVETLHAALASVEVLRDGAKVKQAQADLEQTQAALARLYEHWEEAIELN